MKYINYILFSLLLFISCEREFEIKDPKAGHKLYIESLFYDQQDTVSFTVIATRSTSEPPQQYEIPSGMKITILEDGQPREVLDDEDEGMPNPGYKYDVPEYRWYLTGGFSSGSKVEIMAQADGYPDAYSVVYMPEKFNDFTCRVEKYSEGRAFLHIDYQDDPSTTDFYGVSVKRYSKAVLFDGTVDFESDYGIINQPVSDDFGEYDYPYWNMRYKGWEMWRDMVFWNDSRESVDGKQTFTILISEKQGPDSWLWSDSFGGGEIKGTVYSYDLVYVYKLTPDSYYYLNGQWNEQYNDMAGFGLAPPTYAFTNIRDGIGIFAGMSVSEPYKIDWTNY